MIREVCASREKAELVPHRGKYTPATHLTKVSAHRIARPDPGKNIIRRW